MIGILRILVLLALCTASLTRPAAGEALPSWRNGPVKQAILDFVEAAAEKGSDGFVPSKERIAVFDNDGTLWAEKPVYVQVYFAMDRARQMARKDPGFVSTPALKAAVAGDLEALAATGEKGLLEVVMATHSGMTIEAFEEEVLDWMGSARHPDSGRPFTEMVYQPMLDLLDHLRANGFEIYIVSGGGLDFLRAVAPRLYGVPRENIIGSMGKARLDSSQGKPRIVKDPGLLFVDDKEGKPLAIARHIGRRPVFVAGNSDGDLAMLQWSLAGEGPRFGLIVHHTDAAREWAYDRQSPVGRLDKALDLASNGAWLVVDMARDWKRVFPPSR